MATMRANIIREPIGASFFVDGKDADTSDPAHRVYKLPSGRRVRISPRQREVLDLISLGLTNKEIARKLDINLQTVKNHIANIFVALEARNRPEAVVLALSAGLIQIDEPAQFFRARRQFIETMSSDLDALAQPMTIALFLVSIRSGTTGLNQEDIQLLREQLLALHAGYSELLDTWRQLKATLKL